jgi:hypothetical protein
MFLLPLAPTTHRGFDPLSYPRESAPFPEVRRKEAIPS